MNRYVKQEKKSFRVEGEHNGGEFLFGEYSDILVNKKTFNESYTLFSNHHRVNLSHCIPNIFEEITNSYAPYDLDIIKPFKPFVRDSEGGINSLLYLANMKNGTGDIITDCGFLNDSPK